MGRSFLLCSLRFPAGVLSPVDCQPRTRYDNGKNIGGRAALLSPAAYAPRFLRMKGAFYANCTVR